MAILSGGAAITSSRSIQAKKAVEGRNKRAQRAALVLKQMSDPTRLQVILMLSEGEMQVGTIGGRLNMSQPALSHHLALLRHGGIIAPRRQGKNNLYSLTESGERLALVIRDIVK